MDVPFRPSAPGVINVGVLRDRLAAKAPNSGGTLEPNEYALQMLRFPYRQVFGDPDNTEGIKFYDLDAFQVTIALPASSAALSGSAFMANNSAVRRALSCGLKFAIADLIS